jgi:alpha-N-acetylglucosamine transferase
MVNRHLYRDHVFCCFTNTKDSFDENINTAPLTAHLPGWWAKMELFNHYPYLPEYILYLDLDSLVIGNLDELVQYGMDSGKDLTIIKSPIGPAKVEKGRRHGVVQNFQSSCFLVRNGAFQDLWYKFADNAEYYMRKYRGDQDFLGDQGIDAAFFYEHYFEKISHSGALPSSGTKVVLCHVPRGKNKKAMKWQWVKEVWG